MFVFLIAGQDLSTLCNLMLFLPCSGQLLHKDTKLDGLHDAPTKPSPASKMLTVTRRGMQSNMYTADRQKQSRNPNSLGFGITGHQIQILHHEIRIDCKFECYICPHQSPI